MFLSIVFLLNKKFYHSSFLLTLAILIKIQSIVLLPVIGLVIVLNFNKGQIFKMILFNLILAFMILFPFIINNCLFEVINTLINSVGKWPYVSLNAYNLWFLIFPIPFNSSFLTPHDSVSFLNISYKRVSPIFINRLGRMT
jgi:Gpi18-like mannosyltransferase